jgi:small-conductance mechanosensitive channel
MLPFDPAEMDRSGLRLTRAEFARFLGCSKQAVGEWVTAGKITLGVDGRLDPRQAVAQLLRNSDPARLRTKVLAPLVRDLGAHRRQIAELEARLAAAEERAEFVEAEAAEAAELRGRAAYLNRFAENAGDYLDAYQRLVHEREAELRATPDTTAWRELLDHLDYEAAAIAEGQGAPVETTEGDGVLHDLEAAAAEAAAELVALSDAE